MTKEQVFDALRTCNDPELGVDIVGLGLIYGIEIQEKNVVITMTLTTPGCPLMPYFEQEISGAVKHATGAENVTIKLTFDPPWNPDKMTPEIKQQLMMLRS